MKNIKIEVLFSEHANLFGDTANIRYLKFCLPEAEFIHTKLSEKPKFLNEEMSLVYMGPMTENTQQTVIERLMPYKDEIKKKIESGMAFLFTGNALEVLGNCIETDDGEKIPALGIFDYHAKRDMFHRHNSETLCELDGMKIMGFKSQFTQCYPDSAIKPFAHVVKGMGMNRESKEEGIRCSNFMGTYLLGPLLVNNPCFTRYLLNLIGAEGAEPAFMEAASLAYDERLKDFMEKVPDNVGKYHYM